MEGAAVRPRRNADRLRQAGGGPDAGPRARISRTRRRCGGRLGLARRDRVYLQDAGDGKRRRPPIGSISENGRPEASGGLYYRGDGARPFDCGEGGPGRRTTELRTLPFDPALSPGASNAVNVCLRIQPDEKVTVITDNACLEIVASLVEELDKLGAPYQSFVLEDYAPRPLIDMPKSILEDMETSQ